jgi:proline dehydrogenase
VVSRLGLGRGDYEFQMLYGVRPALGESIARRGGRLRIYVPYGREWYAYCMRRLRENPAIAGYVFRNLFSR